MHPVSYRGTGGARELGPQREAERWVVKLDFVDANPNVRPVGQEPTAAVISYFKGPREEWTTGLPTYASLVYRDLWPGIDLVYTGTGSRLKYTFVVQPGADPNQIKLAYRGATGVRINEAEQLEVSTPLESFQEDKPYAYQEVEGQRLEVAAAYSLEGEASGEMQYGFRLGAYDQEKVLVLDPLILIYAGYIGGSGIDRGFDIAVDSTGNAYVTGWTTSSEATFPVTVGPDLTFNGFNDAFVAKVNPLGTALVYAGYIGGSSSDNGLGIAVDSTGHAYVTGNTGSSEASFPVTVGPDLTFNGFNDAFVAKVNPLGTALVYAGYIGSSGRDQGYGIAVDSTGSAYVTGDTDSSEATFPVTVGPDLTFNGGPRDAFVAKLNPSGAALDYAGYIGGSSNDFGFGIAVDSTGNAYVTGFTTSTETTFPVTVGPDLTFNGAGRDAFVAKVNPMGTALDYAGYIGGSDTDEGFDIAVDSTGNAYVTGFTTSTETTFPVTVGPGLTYNGGGDAFVAKVNPSGTALVYAGYIGGSGGESGSGIAVDSTGNAYVTGLTFSSEATFPVTVGPDLTFNGGSSLGGDAFVAKICGVTLDPASLSFGDQVVGTTSAEQTVTLTNLGSVPLTITGLAAGGAFDQVHTCGTPLEVRGSCTISVTFNPTTLGSQTGEVTITDDACGNAYSIGLSGTGINPVPTLASISPSSTMAGGGDFALTVMGSDFVLGAVVRWNASDRTTIFVDNGELQAAIPASDVAAGGTAEVTVVNPTPGGGPSGSLAFSVIPPPPMVNPGGTVNGASFAPGAAVAPGSIASVFGTNLATSIEFASVVPLPTTLGGATVEVNGIAAPLFFVSPLQINFQLPNELEGQSEATLTVSVHGATGNPQMVSLSSFGPGLFATNQAGSGQGAILIAATGEVAAPAGSIPGLAVSLPSDNVLNVPSRNVLLTRSPWRGEASKDNY